MAGKRIPTDAQLAALAKAREALKAKRDAAKRKKKPKKKKKVYYVTRRND
jgi:hypothetical protein